MTREWTRLLGPEGLVAVGTEPAPANGSRPCVVLLNAGVVHRVGPGRLSVRLARALAAEGHEVVRFDVGGVGDSPPPEDAVDWRACVTRQVRGVLDELERERAHTTFVLVGLCSGANAALRVAREDSRVVGAVLLNASGMAEDPDWLRASRNEGWLRDYRERSLVRADAWRRALTGRIRYRRLAGVLARAVRDRLAPSRRTSETARGLGDDLERLLERGVRLLFVVGAGDHAADELELVLRHAPAGSALGARLERVTLHDTDHTFTLLANQARVLAELTAWSERHFARRS